jgi:hypothetical protein
MRAVPSDFKKQDNYVGGNKFYVMIFFLSLDLGLNSTLDYDSYSEGKKGFIILGLLGLQIVVQISVFLLLFLTVADTFLFRVGLLGFLLRRIRFVLFSHIVYFVMTVVTGTARVNHYGNGGSIMALTTSPSFAALSIIQKIRKFAILLLFLFFFFF